MKIERAGTRYLANGHAISEKALETIGNELFTETSWGEVMRELAQNGEITLEVNSPFEAVNNHKGALEKAKKKIAALERKVAELTLENIFLTA